MLRTATLGIVAAVLLALGTAAIAQTSKVPRAKSCSYWSDVGNVALDGPCSYAITNNNDNFGHVFTLKGGRKVAVEYVDAQTGWHKLSINGIPAIGYEIDRTHLVASTLDLKQSFEVEGI